MKGLTDKIKPEITAIAIIRILCVFLKTAYIVVLSVVGWQHNITRLTQNSTCLITLAMLSKDGHQQQQSHSALMLKIIQSINLYLNTVNHQLT